MIQKFIEFKLIKEAQQDFYNDFINILLLEKDSTYSYIDTLPEEFNDFLDKYMSKLISNRNQFIKMLKSV
jgi:hypothetical protein